MSRRCKAFSLVLSVLAAWQVQAHHSFAMFDMHRTLSFQGTVKQFQWTNPHSWLQVTVVDPKAGEQEWSLELGPLVGLQRAGWKPRVLQPGDKVSVVLHPLRDGSHGGRLMSVTLPDGRVLNGQGGSADAAESRAAAEH